MIPKHSPGIWKYEVKYGKKRPRITVQIPIMENSYHELILGTIGEDECSVADCCCVEKHANAKLIASAPELLLALQDLLKAYLETLEAKYGSNTHRLDNPEIKYALEIIKKATE